MKFPDRRYKIYKRSDGMYYVFDRCTFKIFCCCKQIALKYKQVPLEVPNNINDLNWIIYAECHDLKFT